MDLRRRLLKCLTALGDAVSAALAGAEIDRVDRAFVSWREGVAKYSPDQARSGGRFAPGKAKAARAANGAEEESTPAEKPKTPKATGMGTSEAFPFTSLFAGEGSSSKAPRRPAKGQGKGVRKALAAWRVELAKVEESVRSPEAAPAQSRRLRERRTNPAQVEKYDPDQPRKGGQFAPKGSTNEPGKGEVRGSGVAAAGSGAGDTFAPETGEGEFGSEKPVSEEQATKERVAYEADLAARGEQSPQNKTGYYGPAGEGLPGDQNVYSLPPGWDVPEDPTDASTYVPAGKGTELIPGYQDPGQSPVLPEYRSTVGSGQAAVSFDPATRKWTFDLNNDNPGRGGKSEASRQFAGSADTLDDALAGASRLQLALDNPDSASSAAEGRLLAEASRTSDPTRGQRLAQALGVVGREGGKTKGARTPRVGKALSAWNAAVAKYAPDQPRKGGKFAPKGGAAVKGGKPAPKGASGFASERPGEEFGAEGDANEEQAAKERTAYEAELVRRGEDPNLSRKVNVEALPKDPETGEPNVHADVNPVTGKLDVPDVATLDTGAEAAADRIIGAIKPETKFPSDPKDVNTYEAPPGDFKLSSGAGGRPEYTYGDVGVSFDPDRKTWVYGPRQGIVATGAEGDYIRGAAGEERDLDRAWEKAVKIQEHADALEANPAEAEARLGAALEQGAESARARDLARALGVQGQPASTFAITGRTL